VIDGPTIGSGALRLIEATAVSAEFGMTGKICLTPDQCSVVNEGLSPSQDEISWAEEFFAEFDRDGGEIRNGSDLPRIAWTWLLVTAIMKLFGSPVPFGTLLDQTSGPAAG
jgi:citrate lyase subunit beta / citryl-CoA lyase